jgi:hypothetical protein
LVNIVEKQMSLYPLKICKRKVKKTEKVNQQFFNQVVCSEKNTFAVSKNGDIYGGG